MAAALFAGRTEFARDDEGRWRLSSSPSEDQPDTMRPVIPAATYASGTRLSPKPSVTSEPRAQYSPLVDRAVPRPPVDPLVSHRARRKRGAPDVGPEAVVIPCSPADLLASLSYVVVDVETTGGRPWSGDRITEVAAVVVRDGQVQEVFETLVNPQRSIPPYISALTNITLGMVKDAPVFRDVCDRLLAVMEGHIFVAHNAAFDWRFMTAEIARANGQRIGGRQLCTVRLARKLLPHLRSRSLDHVAHHYGVDITARHRAGGDAVATAHALLGLLRDARDRGCEHWPTLEALIAKRKARKRRGRGSAMPRSMDRDAGA